MTIHVRLAANRLHKLLKQFPAVTILGARQVGKSSLVRAALKNYEFLDLENPQDLARFSKEPLITLEQSKRIIIDEAQREPSLFAVLRYFIDKHPKHSVVLLGSASPSLMKGVSESLTGRTAFLELTGVLHNEATTKPLWPVGGFPALHWRSPKPMPTEFYAAYLRTYLEQDIPGLGYRISARKLYAVLTLAAHMHGQILNLSEMGNTLDLDYHSVGHILDIFEGTFIVRRLQPFHINVKKRLVKSAKIYLRDSGMLHHLLGIPHTRKEILLHPKGGASYEGYCIEQIIGAVSLRHPGAEFYYYRTQTGVETDLIIKIGSKITAVEIKMTKSVPKTNPLEITMNDLGLKQGHIITLTEKPYELARGVSVSNLEHYLNCL